MSTEPNTTETEIESTNYLCCEKCLCTNIAVVKKGFSGKYAIYGYIVASVVGALIVCFGIYFGLDEGNLPLLRWCYTLAALLCLLSFFAGTIQMNDLYSICLRCGNKILINKANSKQP
jgi:hypothetical protein